MGSSNNIHKKLDELNAASLEILKAQKAEKTSKKIAEERKLQEAKLLLEQQELADAQQKSLVNANIREESSAESSVEPTTEQQELVLPIVSKTKISQQPRFSVEFSDFAKEMRKLAIQQLEAVATEFAQTLIRDPEAAAVVAARGGPEAFAERYTADVVENFRQAPRYDEATHEQLHTLEQNYNTFIERIAAQTTHARNDVLNIVDQAFVQDPTPEQQPRNAIAPAATPKPQFSNGKGSTKQEEKEEEMKLFIYEKMRQIDSLRQVSIGYGLSEGSLINAIVFIAQKREASFISSLINSGVSVQNYPNQATLFPCEQQSQNVLERVRAALSLGS